MKKGTPHHPKMYALAEALKVRLPEAVGIMGMLWEFTGDHCPMGDIGSIPDRDIANAVGWVGHPSRLINALCSEKSQWLDRHEQYRLIVHDWPDHAEFSVCRKLKRACKEFLPCYKTTVDDRTAPMEPLAGDRLALQSLPYDDFLKTDHWKMVRKRTLVRAGFRCELCAKASRLNVHHKTYEHKGAEDLHPEDLIVLCEHCHGLFHHKLEGQSQGVQ